MLLQNWLEKTKNLLNLEKESEKEQLLNKLNTLTPQECQENGISILNLEIESYSTSLYGRIKYKLNKINKVIITNNLFKVGDEINLYENKKNNNNINNENIILNGIISKITSMFIEIVSDEFDGVRK